MPLHSSSSKQGLHQRVKNGPFAPKFVAEIGADPRHSGSMNSFRRPGSLLHFAGNHQGLTGLRERPANFVENSLQAVQQNGALPDGSPLPLASLARPRTAPHLPAGTPPAPEPSPPRGTWGGKYEFLLSCVGYCVGVGMGMLLVSSLVCLYYNVIIAWTFYYLGSSLRSPLPWSCQAPQNAPLCGPQNLSSWANASRVSASEAFWNEQVLGVVHSSGLGDPGPVRWPLALCLLLAWTVLFLCLLKGIRSSGKVVYVTATFPYLQMLEAVARDDRGEQPLNGEARLYGLGRWGGAEKESSPLTALPAHPLPGQVWNDAASQLFYSLGIGFGGLLSMASYNPFNNNVIRDTLVIAMGNGVTSFFAGFAIFSVLGHMAWQKKVPVGKVADSGPGLAFVAYPEALALLPASAFWSVLFFLMLFTLGVDTLFGNMEGIVTAVTDEFPSLRDGWRKAAFLGVLCFAFFLLGLLFITEGGIYWFTLVDTYSTSFGLIILALFMCLGVAVFYGERRQGGLLTFLLSPPQFILFYIFLDLSSTTLHYGPYEYPPWGEALGISLGVVTCLQIPLWAGVALWKEGGTLAERFRKAVRPRNTWRTAHGHHDLPHEVVIDVPYTVNLADWDFAGGWQPPDGSEA
nr:sodium-dependent proline transporter-like [Pogona vitticeps]